LLSILSLLKFFDTGFRKQYSNLVRWFETVVHQPKFLRVCGDTTLATKSTLPPPPKKEAPKKQAKKKDGDDDDKEPELEEAGKKLDLMYLSNLPPSRFNLEAWKTKYANTTPTRPEAINWFWENYDPEGWCLYFYHYKWPEECKIDFMTANKFGGFLQRAESVKNLSKFTMTSQVTLKKDDLFQIWGVGYLEELKCHLNLEMSMILNIMIGIKLMSPMKLTVNLLMTVGHGNPTLIGVEEENFILEEHGVVK